MEKVILHDIEKDVIASDIRLYVQHELEEICKRPGCRVPHGWPFSRDVDLLVERAGKLFIWAATAMRFLGAGIIIRPDKQLEIILHSSATHQNPYADLDKLYEVVLTTFISYPRSMDLLSHLRLLLSTVVLLRIPMPVPTLTSFLQIDDVEDLLFAIQSIIPTPRQTNVPVEIYHPSFRDFITTERCKDARFRVDVPSHERWMALHCLELLIEGLTKEVDGVVLSSSSTWLNADVEDLGVKLGEVVGPEVQYAWSFWSSHLVMLKEMDEEVLDMLGRFVGIGWKGQLLQWVVVMSMMGAVREAINCIQMMFSWMVRIWVMLANGLTGDLLSSVDILKNIWGHLHHST